MRLRKVVNRVYAGTTYYRWVVSVPPKAVRELGWVNGQELETIVRGSSLIMEPSLRARKGRWRSSATDLEQSVGQRSVAR